MVKDKSKNEHSIFRNIKGNELKLYIHEAPTCLRLTILCCQRDIYKKCIFLFLTAIFNLVLLLFKIVTINVILWLLFFMLLFLYAVCTTIVEESIVIVQDLGIEIIKKYVIGTEKIFYPQEHVQRIFINEVIFRGKVLFVLTILIKDIKNDVLVPLFIDILPELDLLRVIYNPIKNQLML